MKSSANLQGFPATMQTDTMQTMKSPLMLSAILATAALAAPPAYKVVDKIKVGGGVRWDYAYLDSANHRLYVSHGTQTEVIDTSTDKLVGTIPDTKGVHGIAIAADLGRGFTSDGADNDVTVFDLKTLQVITKVKTGQNPDAIIYEPVTHRVFTMNGRSSDSTAIDAKTGNVITASIPVGGKPEFAQVDGKGHVYANIEDKAEMIEIDAKNALVAKRYSIAPCDSPSGLAIDPKGRLYSVCDNKMMIVSDPATGKVLATPAIGARPDGVAFDDGYAFSANGGDGTITMVGETGGKFEPVATIPTTAGARTIASDQKAHKLYLPAAEFGAPAADKDGKKGRPQAIPDSFQILVVGR
jgi:YVTN family beta-propeller protein